MTTRRGATLLTALAVVLGASLAGDRATGQPSPRRDASHHTIQLPRLPAPQQERRVLLKTPHLEVAAVSLPRGAHTESLRDPSPMLLQVLYGSGNVTISGDDEALTLDRAVYLAPNVEHVLTADEKEGLLLLVQKPAADARRIRQSSE